MGHRFGNVGGGVGAADKAGLEGRGREVDAGLEHGGEKRPEMIQVAGGGLVEIGYPLRVVKNSPNMPPTATVVTGTPASFAACPMPSVSWRVRASSRSYKPSSARSCRLAMPAVMATGLPDRVPAW